jgi:predicted NBD/HSP70 family sugar kinase
LTKQSQGSNQNTIKQDNLALVLNTIRLHGPISRVQISEKVKLRTSTVTNLTRELLEVGLIEESGTTVSKAGRRRVFLRLVADAYYVIGIELSRNFVRCLLTDLGGNIIHQNQRAIKPNRTVLIDSLWETVDECIHESHKRGKMVIGLGIGIPGPLDAASGVIKSPPNFAGLDEFPLKAICEERYGIPTAIDDDARTAAMGEAWFGAGKNRTDLVYLSVGTGVGAGVIIGGRIYRGKHQLAGQIGHIAVDLKGERCACGNTGCLELYLSIPGLAKSIFGTIPTDTKAALMNLNKKDEHFDKAFAQALDYLEWAVASLINLYDPELLIIGGQLIALWPELVTEVTERVSRRGFASQNCVEICASPLSDDASALGGVALVLDKYFSDPISLLSLEDRKDVHSAQ